MSGICNLGFARIDIDRKNRRGFSEVVFCKGKTKTHLAQIIRSLLRHKQDILLTKLEQDIYRFLKRQFPFLKYNPSAKIGYRISKKFSRRGNVVIVTGGTSDEPTAEEAAVTLEVMGNRVRKLYDVGVAGVHRLMSEAAVLQKATVIIVVAGMEGALASIVSGLVCCPVIAVPTSTGYGASFGGLSALLTMLNSCSPGVAVVNIDNGFGAGYFASLINK